MKERLKEPRKGSEIDPETLCLQRVGARKGDDVPFGEGTNDLLMCGKVKADTAGAVGKPSLNRAIIVTYSRPETRVSYSCAG